VARVVVGLFLLVSVITSSMHAGFDPASLILGLLGFPAVLLAWQWSRARHTPTRLQATGIIGFTLNAAIFLALYLTRWYAPGWSFLSDAALLFYGISMWLSSLRGYAGCEVLALSNWLLRRDDQVGCVLFTPIDAARAAKPALLKAVASAEARTSLRERAFIAQCSATSSG
jgi:hypothetical protein